MKRITMQDIADACGLSRNTVSKIFNERGEVPEATRKMVLEKARQLGYYQLPAKEEPAVVYGGTIAVLTQNKLLSHNFGAYFITSFTDHISRAGYTMQMYKVSPEEIEDFLYNDSQIASPFEIRDMDKACARVKAAIENGESICVYGDYDADGVTSTALLYSYLEAVGACVIYYIPSREYEGYGMNMHAVDILHEKGVNLIITVDNGIAAIREIAYAKSLGIDTVVTDHHMPLGELPDAAAVVDLHRPDCPSRFKELSGVGVAFKLIMALEGEYCDADSLLDNYADLLSIGTIGDIVDLRGENRVFVKRGLQSLMNNDRAGILALIRNAGLAGKEITAGSVSLWLLDILWSCSRLRKKCVRSPIRI